jgi:urease alpha subunit
MAGVTKHGQFIIAFIIQSVDALPLNIIFNTKNSKQSQAVNPTHLKPFFMKNIDTDI